MPSDQAAIGNNLRLSRARAATWRMVETAYAKAPPLSEDAFRCLGTSSSNERETRSVQNMARGLTSKKKLQRRKSFQTKFSRVAKVFCCCYISLYVTP